MLDIPPSIFITLIFLFGLCIGSFLNVLIWRLPREKKISGRSECPNCHRTLAWYELLPVVSFMMQRGSCRNCGKPISPRYPIIELATGIAFALVASQFFPHDIAEIILLAKLLFVVSLCIAIFVIDLEHYLILDVLVFPGIGVMLVLNALLDHFSVVSLVSLYSATGSGLFGALVGFLPFWFLWAISKGKWMGFGDVKYIIFMGLALGFTRTIVGLFLAFMVGAFFGLGLMATGKKQFSSKIPFGTFLTLATIMSLFWGHSLWEAYMSLIGL